MAMALIYGGVGAEAIHKFIAVNIIYPDAFAFFYHNIQGMVVVSAVLLFELNIVECVHLFHLIIEVRFEWLKKIIPDDEWSQVCGIG